MVQSDGHQSQPLVPAASPLTPCLLCIEGPFPVKKHTLAYPQTAAPGTSHLSAAQSKSEPSQPTPAGRASLQGQGQGGQAPPWLRPLAAAKALGASSQQAFAQVSCSPEHAAEGTPVGHLQDMRPGCLHSHLHRLSCRSARAQHSAVCHAWQGGPPRAPCLPDVEDVDAAQPGRTRHTSHLPQHPPAHAAGGRTPHFYGQERFKEALAQGKWLTLGTWSRVPEMFPNSAG